MALDRQPLWRHEERAVVAYQTPQVRALVLADRTVGLFHDITIARRGSALLRSTRRPHPTSFRAVVTLPLSPVADG